MALRLSFLQHDREERIFGEDVLFDVVGFFKWCPRRALMRDSSNIT
jgi:hypothetical protein